MELDCGELDCGWNRAAATYLSFPDVAIQGRTTDCAAMVSRLARVPKAPQSPYGLSITAPAASLTLVGGTAVGSPLSMELVMNTTAPSLIPMWHPPSWRLEAE